MGTLLFAALVAFVVIDATAQGGIVRRNRQYVPPSEQAAINLDLHVLCPLLFTVLLCICWAWQGWRWPLAGVLLRVALFDPVLNVRLGMSPFYLGSSARLDRLLRRLGGSVASAVLRVVALGGGMWIIFF